MRNTLTLTEREQFSKQSRTSAERSTPDVKQQSSATISLSSGFEATYSSNAYGTELLCTTLRGRGAPVLVMGRHTLTRADICLHHQGLVLSTNLP